MKIILVVGASGVGKDTLLREAQKHFSRHKQQGLENAICFVKRYIDRMPNASEKNHFFTRLDFHKHKEEFISIWEAHHQIYGIKKADVKPLSIISVSRKAILDFENAYENVVVVHIKATAQNLQKRLEERGRESKEAIQKRLERSNIEVCAKHLIEFYNDLPLQESCAAFNALLEKIIEQKA